MQPQMCPAEPRSCFASLVRGSRTEQAAWQEEMIHSLPEWMRAAKSLLMVCDLGSWLCLLLTKVTPRARVSVSVQSIKELNC